MGEDCYEYMMEGSWRERWPVHLILNGCRGVWGQVTYHTVPVDENGHKRLLMNRGSMWRLVN